MDLWIATCGLWILGLVFKLLLSLAEALKGSEVNPFLSGSGAKLMATMILDQLESSLVQSQFLKPQAQE